MYVQADTTISITTGGLLGSTCFKAALRVCISLTASKQPAAATTVKSQSALSFGLVSKLTNFSSSSRAQLCRFRVLGQESDMMLQLQDAGRKLQDTEIDAVLERCEQLSLKLREALQTQGTDRSLFQGLPFSQNDKTTRN